MTRSASILNRLYLYENKRSTGPFTREELEERYRNGEIDGDTCCCPATLSTVLLGSSSRRLREFFPHFRSPSREKKHDEDDERENRRREEEQEDGESQHSQTVAFDCVECGSSLRLRLQQGHAVYRCPSCKTEYKMVRATGESPVLLVLPRSRHRPEPSDTSARRNRTLPPEVRAALNVLALDEDATFEHVRRAYREVIK